MSRDKQSVLKTYMRTSNIIWTEWVLFKNIHIYPHIWEIKMSIKEGTSFKESGEGYMRRLGRKKGKGDVS